MSTETTVQPDPDFLPADYRTRNNERRWQFWRYAIFASALLTVAAAAFWQYRVGQRLEADLELANWMFEQSGTHSARLAQLQATHASLTNQANLLTHLRRHWPRTQILAAVTTPLPESVRITEIEINRTVVNPSGAAGAKEGRRRSPETEEVQEPPSIATLRLLREEHNAVREKVRLEGTSTDPPALHAYLAALAECDLLANPELLGFERVDEVGGRRYQFTARLDVVPTPGTRAKTQTDPARAASRTPGGGGLAR